MEYHIRNTRKIHPVVILLNLPSHPHYKNALKEFKKTQQIVVATSSSIGPTNHVVALHVPLKKILQMVAPYTLLYKVLVPLTPKSKRAKLIVVLRSVRRTQIVQHSSLMCKIQLLLITARFGL